jgi:hypothetical protein
MPRPTRPSTVAIPEVAAEAHGAGDACGARLRGVLRRVRPLSTGYQSVLINVWTGEDSSALLSSTYGVSHSRAAGADRFGVAGGRILGRLVFHFRI